MPVTVFDIGEAARLVGVSDDTIRRAVDRGDLPATRDDRGRLAVAGTDLVTYLQRRGGSDLGATTQTSARNRFVGLVTDVRTDAVMAQVQLRCGPHTVTSLMSSDSVARLGLQPGCLATAVVKATTVVVETPQGLS